MPIRFDFGFKPRPCIKVSRAQEILREQRVFDPVPSRQTIVNKIQDGTLDGISTTSGYWIYTDSFIAWVKSFQPQSEVARTARPRLRAVAKS